MNFLEGEIDFGERKFVNHEISLRLESQTLSRLQGQQRVTLGVRPENIHMSLNQFEGSIPASTYVSEALGNETFVFLNVGREKIIARTDAAIRIDIETKVWISFEEPALHFFDAVTEERLPHDPSDHLRRENRPELPSTGGV
jgi:multiple sugar transport system ATP-binding protein